MATLGVFRRPRRSRQARREVSLKPARQGGLSHFQVVCWAAAPFCSISCNSAWLRLRRPWRSLSRVEHRDRRAAAAETAPPRRRPREALAVRLDMRCNWFSAVRSASAESRLCFLGSVSVQLKNSACPLIPASESRLVTEKLNFSCKIHLPRLRRCTPSLSHDSEVPCAHRGCARLAGGLRPVLTHGDKDGRDGETPPRNTVTAGVTATHSKANHTSGLRHVYVSTGREGDTSTKHYCADWGSAADRRDLRFAVFREEVIERLCH